MKKISIAFLTIFIVFTSCRKHNLIVTSAAFPNEIGNHWRYEYNSTPASFIDVDIVGSRLLPDGQLANTWVYKYAGYTDTNYVVSDEFLARIYVNPCWTCPSPMLFEKMRYIFPLHVGNIWYTGFPSGDTTKVLANSTLTVPAGTFENTFELSKKRNYVVNAWTNNQIWFTPTVGMTKLNQGEFNLGPVIGNGIWQLANYSLK